MMPRYSIAMERDKAWAVTYAMTALSHQNTIDLFNKYGAPHLDAAEARYRAICCWNAKGIVLG